MGQRHLQRTLPCICSSLRLCSLSGCVVNRVVLGVDLSIRGEEVVDDEDEQAVSLEIIDRLKIITSDDMELIVTFLDNNVRLMLLCFGCNTLS